MIESYNEALVRRGEILLDLGARLVEQAGEHCRVVKALCDGAYDSRENFIFLAERGIEAAIKVWRS